MKHRSLSAYVILTTTLLINSSLAFASVNQDEDDSATSQSKSQRDMALSRYRSLQKSRGFTGPVFVATPPTSEHAVQAEIDTDTNISPQRVRFQKSIGKGSTLAHPSSTPNTSSDLIDDLADQLATTSLGDSAGRPRTESMPGRSNKKAPQRILSSKSGTKAIADESELTTATESQIQAESSVAPVRKKAVAIGAPSPSDAHRRKRSVKRSHSTNDSTKNAIASPTTPRKRTEGGTETDHESTSFRPSSPLKMTRSVAKNPPLDAVINVVDLDADFRDEVLPAPLSPRGLEVGRAPSAKTLLAALQQNMFFVPEKQAYVRALFNLNAGNTHSVVQEVVDALALGKTGYTYKIDFDSPSQEPVTVEYKKKQTTYPITICYNRRPLFSANCYLIEEGPTHNLVQAVKQALKSGGHPLYTFSEAQTLVVTEYVDEITDEKRTVFTSFRSGYLDNFKKHDLDLIASRSIKSTHTYNTTKNGDILCLASPERVGYFYSVWDKKKNEYIGTIRVSAFPVEFAEHGIASAKASSSAATPE